MKIDIKYKMILIKNLMIIKIINNNKFQKYQKNKKFFINWIFIIFVKEKLVSSTQRLLLLFIIIIR